MTERNYQKMKVYAARLGVLRAGFAFRSVDIQDDTGTNIEEVVKESSDWFLDHEKVDAVLKYCVECFTDEEKAVDDFKANAKLQQELYKISYDSFRTAIDGYLNFLETLWK